MEIRVSIGSFIFASYGESFKVKSMNNVTDYVCEN